MKKLVIVSGKGGVGKTVITASLAFSLNGEGIKPVVAEGDVDTPNLHLLLGFKPEGVSKVLRASRKAKIDSVKCLDCGACYEACQFSAIRRGRGKYYVDTYLCEGCGTCSLVCPVNAISISEELTGEIYVGSTRYGFPMVTAKLRAGEKNSGLLVTEVKKLAESLRGDLTLIDGAPGIGCEVISAISGSDYVIAVTEPTPPSFNGFKRLLELTHYFKVQTGLIVNKSTINESYLIKLESYAKERNVEILAKLPFDFKVVEALATGKPVTDYDPSSPFSRGLSRVVKFVKELMK